MRKDIYMDFIDSIKKVKEDSFAMASLSEDVQSQKR